MKTEQVKKIEAARKAFQAYERAVAAAREIIADGPVRGLGTTVMEAQYSEWRNSGPHGYKCSECGFTARTSIEDGWKYCPGCGAEIVRFARDPEHEPKPLEKVEFILVEEPKREPEIQHFIVSSEKPKKEPELQHFTVKTTSERV